MGGAKMNRKLVKPVLFVIFSLSLTAIITGCLLSPKSQTNRNINKDKISAKESQSTLEQTGNETHASETNISEEDISEAKAILQKHFKAIKMPAILLIKYYIK
ncbi:hypothetical protein Cthe_3009 [Acetivibrio thermocellus ATCC 27405]|uniref:Lipoprotein n=2 Tax=Acetivibrio thermocellus TaxID=1515 RepID=A3DJS6_ACET2|nr:hypothetical protein Cthe_3009 [Acetivibrio thermocellus ATCC 27405]